MKKSYLIAIILAVFLLVLLGASYWYSQSKKGDVEVIVKTASETANEEVLPLVSTNPLDNKPNINPADQTNPFNNIKINPFE
ncbi:MAG: hypothetical protein WCL13_03730 [bacterium]